MTRPRSVWFGRHLVTYSGIFGPAAKHRAKLRALVPACDDARRFAVLADDRAARACRPAAVGRPPPPRVRRRRLAVRVRRSSQRHRGGHRPERRAHPAPRARPSARAIGVRARARPAPGRARVGRSGVTIYRARPRRAPVCPHADQTSVALHLASVRACDPACRVGQRFAPAPRKPACLSSTPPTPTLRDADADRPAILQSMAATSSKVLSEAMKLPAGRARARRREALGERRCRGLRGRERRRPSTSAWADEIRRRSRELADGSVRGLRSRRREASSRPVPRTTTVDPASIPPQPPRREPRACATPSAIRPSRVGFSTSTTERSSASTTIPSAGRLPARPGGFRWCRFRRFPYAMIYELFPTVTHVLAVAADRRRPGYWAGRK